MAGRFDPCVAPGEGGSQQRGNRRRLPVSAKALQAFVVAVQGPHVIAILQAAPAFAVEAKVLAVDRLGLFQLPDFQKESA